MAKASALKGKYAKLLSLPGSIVECMLGWLDPLDVCRVGFVCIAWNKHSASDTVWRSCVSSKWSISSGNARRIVNPSSHGGAPNINWRSRYRELVRIARNWKMGNYQKIILHGHSARINSMLCGANILISCSDDNTIRIWDIPTRRCLHILQHGHTERITDFDFDEKELISGSQDGIVRIWSILTGKEEGRFHTTAHRDTSTVSVSGLRITPERIFCGGSQGQIYIWDREKGNLLHSFITPFSSIIASDRPPVECIDVDGNNFVVGVGDHVYLYDLTIHNGEYATSLRLTMHHASVRTVRILTTPPKSIVTLGRTHMQIFSITTGLLRQSFLIRNNGFIPVVIPDIKSQLIFDRFILETPDKDANSSDLSFVRIWRIFGPKIAEADAFKILVSGHSAKCSNVEVLATSDRPDHGITLHDFTIPTPPRKKTSLCHKLKSFFLFFCPKRFSNSPLK
ncbi:MAG: F-box/WD repeat-containing protein 7 [Hyperionvirus sp.]|uniref:F-box/WD repeat-containing protein 7 n=1 Tax=Hyperionvirus sp. TaxID=2487770 RepID=A0A3G5ABD4_9VIRU|nr:MAG: F-box/WD repeat-containing protein 7 [Hyperionvirus sp.]